MDKSFNYKSNHFSRSKYVFISSSAVFAGGLIYILFRPTEPAFLNWFSLVGIESWLFTVRDKTLTIYSFLPQWSVYSLTNGLWSFAYTLIVLCIWTGSNSLLKHIWFLSIPVFVFGVEVLQLTGNLQGTFCLNDIIWSAIGITIGFITAYLLNRRNRDKKSHDYISIDRRIH